jgi:hypothetical protein
MPINYHQVQKQMPLFCERAAKHHQSVLSAARLLLDLLDRSGKQANELAGFVEAESMANKMLRCAKPHQEPPAGVHELPEFHESVTLIGADGSQINPSRHRQVDFGLINVATICMRTGMDAAPIIDTESTLLDNYELTAGNIALTENIIALERDIRERAALLSHSLEYSPPPVTLTDGPLELFRETNETSLIEKKLGEYISILTRFYDKRIMTAGYVDRPQSDLVTRMLKLYLNKNSARSVQEDTNLEYIKVADANLFNVILLNPGARSAVFAIQSPWANHFKDVLALCFFYMNVSRSEQPYLARVELPAWCANSPILLDTLQAVVFQQCEIMGIRPYPYILHRAHEVALVTFEETAQLDSTLAIKLQQLGTPSGMKSNKQSAKDLPGRGRYT